MAKKKNPFASIGSAASSGAALGRVGGSAGAGASFPHIGSVGAPASLGVAAAPAVSGIASAASAGAAHAALVLAREQAKARRAQRQIIRTYVLDKAKHEIVHKNAAMDAQGNAVRISPARTIGEDVFAAAERIKPHVHALANNPIVKAANKKTQVITKKGLPTVEAYTAANKIGKDVAVFSQGAALKESVFHPSAGLAEQGLGYLGKVLGARSPVAPPDAVIGAHGAQLAPGASPTGTEKLEIASLLTGGSTLAGSALARGTARLAGAKVAARNAVTYATNPRLAIQALPLAAKGKFAGLVASGSLASEPVVSAFTQGSANEFQALRKHPLETLGSTGRVLESLPGALLAIPADAYLAAKEGNTKPLEGFINQQKEYLKMYSTLAGGEPYQTSVIDPKTGKRKTVSLSGEQVAEQQLGLVPALTAGLSGLALAKGISRIHAPKEETLKIDRQTRSLAEKINDPSITPRERAIAKKKLAGLARTRGESPRTAQVGRRVESQRASTRTQAIHNQAAREYSGAGQRRIETAGASRENFPELMARLHHEPVNEHISKADVVRYLGSHGYRDDTKNVLGLVADDLKNLSEPKVAIGADELATRPVMRAILDNPQVLSDAGVKQALDATSAIQAGRSVEAHSLHTDEGQTAAHPLYEVPTHVPQAKARGILLPWERKPSELSGVKLKERSGRDMDAAIRTRAKDLQRKAKRLEETAKELDKQGRDKRAAIIRNRAARYRAEAETHLAVVDRQRRANGLLRKAVRIEEGKPRKGDYLPDGTLPDPKQLRAQADALIAADAKAEGVRKGAFMEEVRVAQKAHNLAPPVYFKQRDVTRIETIGGQEYPGTRTPPKDKHLEARLQTQGRVNEAGWATLANMDAQRITIEMDRSVLGALRENSLRLGGHDSIFLNSAELQRLHLAGAIPKGYERMPASKFAGSISRNAELDRMLQEARYRAETEPSGSRNLYVVWPRSRAREFDKQIEPWAGWQRAFRKVGRVQAGLMLGTSPTWAAFQIPANPLVLIAQHWNPAAYARAAKSQWDFWRKATPTDKAHFEAALGATSGDFLRVGNHDPELGLRPDTVEVFSRARHMVGHSPLGRFGAAAYRAIKTGGPLPAAVRKMEAQTRLFGTFLEMDRLSGLDLRGNTRVGAHVRGAVDSILHLQGTVYKHMDDLKVTPRKDWPRYYANHPKAMGELQTRLFDAMGEWASLTTRERSAASVTAFYPFLRMSLRWMFYAFPKNHPLKAALLLNLAQSNVAAYEKEIGGKPSFLQDFGAIVTHPQGEPSGALMLARSAPGGNALVEALSGGKLDASTIFRVATPIAGITYGALEGKDVFGNEVKGASFLDLIGRGVANLSPLTRPLAAKIGPGKSDLSLLFQAIQGKKKGLAGTLIPQLTVRPYDESQTVRLSRLVDTAYGAPSQDDVKKVYGDTIKGGGSVHEARQAQDAAHRQYLKGQAAFDKIDALMRAYGIETAAEQKKAGEDFSSGYSRFYHKWPISTPSKKKDSFGLPGFDLGGGGKGGGGFSGFSFGGGGGHHKPTAKKGSAPKASGSLASIPSIGNSRQVAPTVAKLAKERGLQPSVLMAQLQQESNFNPGANSGLAGGESQFTPSTAQSYGVQYGTSAKALRTQLEGQANYMADLVKSQGSVEGALNAYYGSAAPFTDAEGTGSYAQKVLAKAKAYTALDSGNVKGALGSKHYSKPFPHADMGRIDMGVDYTGSGNIKSIGKAKVTRVGAPGWPNGGAGPSGQGVLYQLLDGPQKGKHIYVYEGVTPRVKAGQTVKKGQTIASFYPGSSIEIGFADSAGSPIASSYYNEGDVTKPGQRAASFLQRIGQPGTTPGGVAPSGSYSSGTPSYTSSTGTPPTSPVGAPGGSGAERVAGRRPHQPSALRLLSLLQKPDRSAALLNRAGVPQDTAATTTQGDTLPLLAQDYMRLKKLLKSR